VLAPFDVKLRAMDVDPTAEPVLDEFDAMDFSDADLDKLEKEAVELFESQHSDAVQSDAVPSDAPEDEDVQKSLQSMNQASEFIRKETGIAPALIQFQKNDADGNFLAHLRVYYQRLFPFQQYYRWLSYGESMYFVKNS